MSLTQAEESQLAEYNRQQTNVIVNTCNVVGCDNCSLKFDGPMTGIGEGSGECQSTWLQDKIMDLEYKQMGLNND